METELDYPTTKVEHNIPVKQLRVPGQWNRLVINTKCDWEAENGHPMVLMSYRMSALRGIYWELVQLLMMFQKSSIGMAYGKRAKIGSDSAREVQDQVTYPF